MRRCNHRPYETQGWGACPRCGTYLPDLQGEDRALVRDIALATALGVALAMLVTWGVL